MDNKFNNTLNESGYVYILKNPSFPEYVKIGYADDVEKRVKDLNRTSATPYAFRLYAKYKVNNRLEDKDFHNIIDILNPDLRAIDNVDGKERKREFFEMSPEKAYELFRCIARINGLEKNLTLVEPTEEEIKDEEEAEVGRTNRTQTYLPRMEWLMEQGIIKIGDEVYIISHPEKIAKVKDKDNVIYNNKVISFNKFGCEITGWKSIQIYAYMKIVDGPKETLAELREKRMSELGMIK